MDPGYLSHLTRNYPELGTTLSGPQLDTLAFIIHSERALITDNHYVPFDFQGLDNSGDGFMAAYFNWRWFKRDSEDYKCVTVEFGRTRHVLNTDTVLSCMMENDDVMLVCCRLLLIDDDNVDD